MFVTLKRLLLSGLMACLYIPSVQAAPKNELVTKVCDTIIQRLGLDEKSFQGTKPYSYLVPEAVALFRQQMHSELDGKMLLRRVLRSLENIQELPGEMAKRHFLLADYHSGSKVIRARMTADAGKSKTLLSVYHQTIYASEDQLPQFGMYFLPTLMQNTAMRARMWAIQSIFNPLAGSNAWKVKAFKGEHKYLTALKAKEKKMGDLLRLTLHEAGVEDEFLEIVYQQLLEMNDPFNTAGDKVALYKAAMRELGLRRERFEENMSRVARDQNVSKVLFIYTGADENEYVALRFHMNANAGY